MSARLQPTAILLVRCTLSDSLVKRANSCSAAPMMQSHERYVSAPYTERRLLQYCDLAPTLDARLVHELVCGSRPMQSGHGARCAVPARAHRPAFPSAEGVPFFCFLFHRWGTGAVAGELLLHLKTSRLQPTASWLGRCTLSGSLVKRANSCSAPSTAAGC